MAEIFDKYNDGLKKAAELTSRLEKTTGSLSKATSDLAGVTDTLTNSFKKYGGTISDLYQSQLRIERGMRSTGISASTLTSNLNSLNRSTNLSIVQTTKLFESFEKGYVGIRKMDVLRDVIKNVNQLGVTAEETERILGSLGDAQKRFVTIAERVNSGKTLTMFERMTLDPQVVRDLDALTLKARGLASVDPKKQDFLKNVAEMEKAWGDAWLKMQEAAVPMLTQASKTVTEIADGLKPVVRIIEKLSSSGVASKMVMGYLGYKGFQIANNAYGNLNRRLMGGGTHAADSTLSPLGRSGPSSVGGNLVVYGNLIVHGTSTSGVPGTPGAPGTPPASRMARAGRFALGAAPMVASLGGLYAESKFDAGGTSEDANGNLSYKEPSNKGWMLGGRTASMAGMGAMMGSIVGPWGTALGALAGAAYGATTALNDLSDAEKKARADFGIRSEERKLESDMKAIQRGIETSVRGGNYGGVKEQTAMLMQRQIESLGIKAQHMRAAGNTSGADAAVAEQAKMQQQMRDPDAFNMAVADNLAQGMKAVRQELEITVSMIGQGIAGLQQMADIEREFYLDGAKASDMLRGQIGYGKQILEARQAEMVQAKSMLEYNREQVVVAEKNVDNAKTEEERNAAILDLQQKRRDVNASNAEIQAKQAQIESQHKSNIESIIHANQQNFQVAQTQMDAEKEWFEQRGQLINQLRMGMGQTYQSMVDQLNVSKKQISVSEMQVEGHKKSRAELMKIARASSDINERERASRAIGLLNLKITQAESDVMKSKVSMLEKFNQLREGYINRLSEESFGGADIEYDPTQASGLVNFMGTGSQRGHFMVGGVGGPQGKKDIAGRMGKYGNYVMGDTSMGSYAQSDEMARRSGVKMVNGVPVFDPSATVGNIAPDISNAAIGFGGSSYYGAGNLGPAGHNGMSVGGMVVTAPSGRPIMTTAGGSGSVVGAGASPGTVQGNMTVTGNLIINGRSGSSSGGSSSGASVVTSAGSGGSRGVVNTSARSAAGGGGGKYTDIEYGQILAYQLGSGPRPAFLDNPSLRAGASAPAASPVVRNKPMAPAPETSSDPTTTAGVMGSDFRKYTVGAMSAGYKGATGGDGYVDTKGASTSQLLSGFLWSSLGAAGGGMKNLYNGAVGQTANFMEGFMGGGGGTKSAPTNIKVHTTCGECMRSIASKTINTATNRDIEHFESGNTI